MEKIFRTLKSLDAYLFANNYRASDYYVSWQVADQVIGGRLLHYARESGEIEPIEVTNEKGKKEWVFKSSDVKRLALQGIKS